MSRDFAKRAAREPIFLVGALRSGTTLLRLLLDRHPSVHWFGEFEYPTRWCGGAGWPDVADFRAKLQMDRAFRRDGLTIDPALDYVALVHSFLDQHRARAPSHEIFGCTVHGNVDRLYELWPDAQFIHLLRDPRDVARSCVGLGWDGHPYSGVTKWMASESGCDKLRAQLPEGRFCEVRYEDLVRDPKGNLDRLCEFLEIQPDPRMLEPSADSTYRAPDAKLAEQWKRKMSERDVRRVEARLGPKLQESGYEPSGFAPLRINALERFWLALRNKWGRARFGIGRYGFLLWLQRAVSLRVGPSSWRRSVQLRINAVDTENLR